VPVRGELVSGPPGFEIEVLDADPRRVKRAKIYRSKGRRPPRSREDRGRTAELDSIKPQSAAEPKLQPSRPEP
jgi:hypothetical protein